MKSVPNRQKRVVRANEARAKFDVKIPRPGSARKRKNAPAPPRNDQGQTPLHPARPDQAGLDKLRKEISDIDERILDLLGRRRTLAREVIKVKDRHKMPLRDTQREEALLANLIHKGRELGLEAHLITRVFHEIIDDSIRSQQNHLQKNINPDRGPSHRVAYQGTGGAYSHLAAKKFFGDALEMASFTGFASFPEVVEAVEEGFADYGMLPVENTTAGSINEVYDLLSRTKLSIVGEEVYRVDHCLIGLREVPLATLRKVYSHPQALAQCARFLSQLPNCRAEEFTDTAMAVQMIKAEGDPAQAAVASEEAAKLYGLEILARNIADHRENYTRFLVVAQKPIQVDPRVPSKTSIIMATWHEEGALLRALDVLHRAHISLTKLESRPKPGSPFEYLFYIDFEGGIGEERVSKALEELRGATSYLKILGSYPSEIRSKTAPRVEAYIAPAGIKAGDRDDLSDVKPMPPPRVKSAVASYRLASRQTKANDTVIRIRGVQIGDDDFVMIAGPCSVESKDQIRSCARQVKECGGKILRGGCFKPRTSPYAFQGLGFEGLELLAAAGKEYDLPVITEVLSPSDVAAVARVADILQIGARNMQNFSLLNEVGKVNRPVMLKRGMMASIEEFLNAAEYILSQGNQQVILCERGIRTFETATRNTLDLGAIPILKQLTHLPIFVDPSHAAGQRDLVIPLALAAHAVGPHGMMVEIHPDPENALSDGPQALRFDDFAHLMSEIYLKRGRDKSARS
jgi:chorismate mutase/prephenate dehydratase